MASAQPTKDITTSISELTLRETSREEKVKIIESVMKTGNRGDIEKLVEAGADVDDVNVKGRALVKAGQIGNLQVLNFLLEAGADVNSADDEGKTALMHTSHEGHDKCVELLIQKGADVNLTDTLGNTAVLLAVSLPEHREQIMNFQQRVNEGMSFSWVVEKFVKCTDALIQEGADVNMQNKNGEPPLISAVKTNLDKCVTLLLEAGADVNLTDTGGCTALHHAAVYRNSVFEASSSSELVTLLLQAGAHVSLSKNHELKSRLEQLLRIELFTGDYAVMLLFTAGETIDVTTDKGMQRLRKQLNIQDAESGLDLKHLSREAIRKHLLDLSPVNLFVKVPQLGLPSSLAKYLLYDLSLETET